MGVSEKNVKWTIRMVVNRATTQISINSDLGTDPESFSSGLISRRGQNAVYPSACVPIAGLCDLQVRRSSVS